MAGRKALTSDVTWVGESFRLGPDRFEHVSVYLIEADGGWILVDSGSFHSRASLLAEIREGTRGEGIQALILSHSDYPHSANVPALRETWGDFEIVASCGDPGIQGLPYATRVHIGGTQEVLGRRFRFIDPPLADRSHTSWVYDEVSKVLFVADGFGSYHRGRDALSTSRDLPHGIDPAAIAGFHADAVPWLKYVDPPYLMERLAEMLADHPPSWVAPIHGPPIAAEHLPAFLASLFEAVTTIVAQNRL